MSAVRCLYMVPTLWTRRIVPMTRQVGSDMMVHCVALLVVSDLLPGAGRLMLLTRTTAAEDAEIVVCARHRSSRTARSPQVHG